MTSYSKEYYIKNRAKMIQNSLNRYYKNKKKSVSEQIKRQQKRKKYDSEFAMRLKLKWCLRNAIRRYLKTGKYTSSKIYGVDWKAIVEYLHPFPKEVQSYNVDHIIPLSKFNLLDSEQVKIAFAPENHQWLLREDNLHKGTKVIEKPEALNFLLQ